MRCCMSLHHIHFEFIIFYPLFLPQCVGMAVDRYDIVSLRAVRYWLSVDQYMQCVRIIGHMPPVNSQDRDFSSVRPALGDFLCIGSIFIAAAKIAKCAAACNADTRLKKISRKR